MIRELKTGVEWPKYNRENPMEYNERRLYRTKIFVRLLDKRYHGFKQGVRQCYGWESAPVKSQDNWVSVYLNPLSRRGKEFGFSVVYQHNELTASFAKLSEYAEFLKRIESLIEAEQKEEN